MTTDSPAPKAPRAPAHLGCAGRRFWYAVQDKYALRVDESLLLESACRVLDVLTRLDEEMRDQPLVVKGSMGQAREHPLLSEARQQRATLARLLVQLRLPEEEAPELDGASRRSHWGRDMAAKRWAH